MSIASFVLCCDIDFIKLMARIATPKPRKAAATNTNVLVLFRQIFLQANFVVILLWCYLSDSLTFKRPIMNAGNTDEIITMLSMIEPIRANNAGFMPI